jgi:hypothetical protein
MLVRTINKTSVMVDSKQPSELQTTSGIEVEENRYLHQPRNDNSFHRTVIINANKINHSLVRLFQ